MSDTPRTDEQLMSGKVRYTDMVHCDFARKLEREIATERKRNEMLTDYYECKMADSQRVSRIERELAEVATRALEEAADMKGQLEMIERGETIGDYLSRLAAEKRNCRRRNSRVRRTMNSKQSTTIVLLASSSMAIACLMMAGC